MKRLKSKYLLIISILCCMFIMPSCSDKNMNADSIFDNALVTIKELKNTHMNMVVSYDLVENYKGEAVDVSEKVDCDIITTSNPAIAKIEAVDEFEYNGESQKNNIYMYTIESEENLITYSMSKPTDSEDEDESDAYNNGKWYKSLSDPNGGQFEAQMSLIKTCAKNRSSFSVDKKEKINNRKCYKVSGILPAKELTNTLLNMANKHTVSMIEVLDVDDYDDNVNISIWFDIKNSRPLKIEMDLKELMNSVIGEEYTGQDYEYDVDDYKITITYNSFNNDDIIEIPEEVMVEAQTNFDQIPDDEQLKEYFKDIDLSSVGLDIEDMENWTTNDWEKAKSKLYDYYGIKE